MTGDEAFDDMHIANAVPRLRTDELLDTFAKAGPKIRELVRIANSTERAHAAGQGPDARADVRIATWTTD